MKKIAVLLLLITSISFSRSIYALEEAGVNLPDQKIYPRSFYYPVKRLLEKVGEKILFSDEARFNFNKGLLLNRLAELTFVVQENQIDQVQKSSERFSYQAGVTTEKITDLKDNQNQKKALLDQFGSYSKVLEKLRDHYPANSTYWMLIQHSINSIKIYSEELKK